MRLKRIISLILVIVMCLSFAACKGQIPTPLPADVEKSTGSAIDDNKEQGGSSESTGGAIAGGNSGAEAGNDSSSNPEPFVDPVPQPIDPPGAKDRNILMSGVSASEVRWNEEGTKIIGPIPPEYVFTTVEDDYFADALFIGDSRSVGIEHFGKLSGPHYFVKTSMSVYNYSTIQISEKSTGDTKLQALLDNNTYGKAYIGLGINELGYGLAETAEKFRGLIELLKENNPDMTIYLMANLHVTAARSDTDKTFNNSKLNTMNTMLYNLAEIDVTDNVYYIDVNPVFDDENGNLMQKYTNDNTHLFTKYYTMWIDFLKSHAIAE